MSDNFVLPLATGLKNKHWIIAADAHLLWENKQGNLDDNTLFEARKQLETLSSTEGEVPQPSWHTFRIFASRVLPAKPNDILAQVPEKMIVCCCSALLMKENNDITLKKYYEYRNTFKDLAFNYEQIIQKINGQVTTVGYVFAQTYSNLKVVLADLIANRKYVEVIIHDDSLASYTEGYSVEKLDFISEKLDLFNVSTFSSSNQNWFVESAKDLANLTKGVIRFIKDWYAKREIDVDPSVLSSAESSANSVINYSVKSFKLDFEHYSALFTQMHNAFSTVWEVLSSSKMNFTSEEIAGLDKNKYFVAIRDMYLRIFDGERKREVFEKIFYEASEVDNMIYKLAQRINNEYRDSKEPVCCVGFTEGAIILLGKIVSLLNFPLYLITDKLSFYGTEFSADTSKEVEIQFDNSKYDGKRVLVLDDILDRGVTVKKFLEQARKKTKAIDFKVCMLFAKPNPENVYGDADFLGSMVPNVWVVGYGFDTNYKHRNADAVGPIKESFKSL